MISHCSNIDSTECLTHDFKSNEESSSIEVGFFSEDSAKENIVCVLRCQQKGSLACITILSNKSVSTKPNDEESTEHSLKRKTK